MAQKDAFSYLDRCLERSHLHRFWGVEMRRGQHRRLRRPSPCCCCCCCCCCLNAATATNCRWRPARWRVEVGLRRYICGCSGCISFLSARPLCLSQACLGKMMALVVPSGAPSSTLVTTAVGTAAARTGSGSPSSAVGVTTATGVGGGGGGREISWQSGTN
jgi:hypothetical protein